MNIIIPISGQNPYFNLDEYAFPKPLIDIFGQPMIEHTLTGFKALSTSHHYTFIAPTEWCRQYSLDHVLSIICQDHPHDIVRLDHATHGAICSLLMAIDKIDPDEELVISNSDHVFTLDLNDIFKQFTQQNADVAVATFTSTHPRWSYVRTDQNNNVVETSEKRVISNQAIAGLYYFRKGNDFIEAAKRVILNGLKINKAYYISQAINELILMGKQVNKVSIPQHCYFNLYNPQKVSEYEKYIRDAQRAPTLQVPHDTRPVLIIPAAGEGSRFKQAGYDTPKPFIPVHDRPMIAHVMQNLQTDHMRTVVLARQSHLDQANAAVSETLNKAHITVVPVSQLTEGTACTVLLARHLIDPKAPLIIANSDQLVDFNIMDFVNDCLERDLDGSILCFQEPTRHPKWSYAKTNAAGHVTEVKEKEAISDLATVGIYLFRKGETFLSAALDMIAHNDRVNNEFYTCPVYNYAIQNRAKIGVYTIDATAMHGLGTPEDLDQYLSESVPS